MKRIPLLIALFLLAAPVMAQSINIAWDAYPDSGLISGFKLYQRKGNDPYPTTAVAVFVPTATTGAVAKPLGYGRWYWVLRAYVDAAGEITESENSNEISMVIKPPAPKLTGAILSVLTAPIKGAQALWAVGGGREKKNLRIVS